MLLPSTFMLCGIILLLLCAFVTVGLFLPYKRFSRQYSFTDLLDYAVLGPKDTVILKNGALMKVYRIIPVCTSYLNEHDAHKIHSMLCSSIKKLDKTYILSTKGEHFGYVCFTSEKQFYAENYPGIVMENGNIDDLILMMTGGK